MHRLKPFQSYFSIFYVFGLNPFISFNNPKEKRSKIIELLLRFMNILLSSFVIYMTDLTWRHAKWLAIFRHFMFTFDVCINYIAVFENVINFNATCRILQSISTVTELFAKTFAPNFPYNAMNKTIKWKFLLIMSTVILKFFGHSGKTAKIVIKNFLWTIFDTVTNIHLLHLLFYIEFMKFILIGLSEKISSLSNGTRVYWRHENSSEWLYVIHQIKLIHFKLWRIANAVNLMFGWFLLSFMMEQATKFIFYAYYIFHSANSHENHPAGIMWIFRKYYRYFALTV